MVTKATPNSGCGFMWLDMLRTGEKLLRAGLRQQIGPAGDLDAAYRQWYSQRMEEHHHLVAEMSEKLKSLEEEEGHAS